MKNKLSRTKVVIFLGAILFSGTSAWSVQPPTEQTNTPKIYRGSLVWGHEVRSFKPCGSQRDWWVVDQTEELRGVYQSLTHEPYQPIYVELQGQYGTAPTKGFGVEYDGQLTVSELLRAAVESKGCTEDPSNFSIRARGNEPSWSIDISIEGIVFSHLGEPPKLVFPYQPVRVMERGKSYSSSVEMPKRSMISIEFRNERCIDTMSGEHFSYRAAVRLDDRKFYGCAYQGEQ